MTNWAGIKTTKEQVLRNAITSAEWQIRGCGGPNVSCKLVDDFKKKWISKMRNAHYSCDNGPNCGHTCPSWFCPKQGQVDQEAIFIGANPFKGTGAGCGGRFGPGSTARTVAHEALHQVLGPGTAWWRPGMSTRDTQFAIDEHNAQLAPDAVDTLPSLCVD